MQIRKRTQEHALRGKHLRKHELHAQYSLLAHILARGVCRVTIDSRTSERTVRMPATRLL